MSSAAPKHRVVVRRVLPRGARWRDARAVALLVSLDAGQWTTDRRVSALVWAVQRFEVVTVVIGDTIHRLTLQIRRRDLNEDGATARAVSAASREAHLWRAAVQTASIGAVSVRLASEFERMPEYARALREIVTADDRDAAFHDAVVRSASAFLSRSGERVARDADAVDLAIRYVIEELAVFSVMVASGIELDIYPSRELGVLEEILAGELPSAPDALRRRVNVEIGFRRRGAPS